MVMKQILKDLKREWSWALFYIIVTTMMAMAFTLLALSFTHVKGQTSSIQSFIDQKVIFFQKRALPMEPHQGSDVSSPVQKLNPQWMDDLQRLFSRDGKAGSYVFVGSEGVLHAKYEQILILVGRYSELSGLSFVEPMVLFAPHTHPEDVGKSVQIAGQMLKVVGSTDSTYHLFHPMHTFSSDDPIFSNTLILCTYDFQMVCKMFPWWDISNAIFDRMMLVNPSDAEVRALQRDFYEHNRMLYEGITTDTLIQRSTSPQIRAHRLYLWFYILSGLLFLILFLGNMVRMVETRITDYTVHHLYGAPITILQKRAAGFVLFLHFLPIVGVLYILKKNQASLVYVSAGLILVATLCMISAIYITLRMGRMTSLQNLRRDN